MNQQQKTVWIISKYGSPQIYRFSSKSYRLAKYLSDNGYNAYLISSDSNHVAQYPPTQKRFNWEEDGKLKHVWIKTLKYQKSSSLRRLLSWFSFEWHLNRLDTKKMQKPDVVLISSLSLITILTGLKYRKKYGCKLIFEVRDIHPLTLTEELGVSEYNPFVLWLQHLEKKAYERADLIVGTMPNLADHVSNIIGYEKEVFFSPLGINEWWDKPTLPSNEIDNLFPTGDKTIIGYAGSIGKTNALDSFIEAIETLKEDSRFFFVIIGKGDLKDKYEEKLKNSPNVRFGKKIQQYEVPYFLSKCDILYLSTHPSKVWDYGQSMNKLVDYMMAGKPVIASYSGFPSMLNEAGSGVFIPPNSKDEIISALNHYADMSKQDREIIGAKGKEWLISHYSNEVVGQRYLSKINQLLR